MDPADRGLDSWDPWAEESQDPTPFVDRDEDQSAAERPRRGSSDAQSRASENTQQIRGGSDLTGWILRAFG